MWRLYFSERRQTINDKLNKVNYIVYQKTNAMGKMQSKEKGNKVGGGGTQIAILNTVFRAHGESDFWGWRQDGRAEAP